MYIVATYNVGAFVRKRMQIRAMVDGYDESNWVHAVAWHPSLSLPSPLTPIPPQPQLPLPLPLLSFSSLSLSSPSSPKYSLISWLFDSFRYQLQSKNHLYCTLIHNFIFLVNCCVLGWALNCHVIAISK